ncbi:MAG: helix-turn-helix domain-containing protein [Planctomycetota bacterium]
MSAFVGELKRLISRLSKKEVKLALQRGRGLRKENQSLRARLRSLEVTMKQVLRSIAKTGHTVPAAAGGAGATTRLRLTARGIKSLRTKTRLSQAQFAKLVDVSVLTVSNWELGKSLPRKRSAAFAKLIEIRQSKLGARAAKKTLEGLAAK